MLEKTFESPLDYKEIKPDQILKKSVLNIHWKDWCWNWNSNPLVTWCEKVTHWKRPWCWERLKAGGEGNNRRSDGWMASPTRWTWVWESSRSWWVSGKPGVLQSVGLQRVGQDWVTELNWIFFTNVSVLIIFSFFAALFILIILKLFHISTFLSSWFNN